MLGKKVHNLSIEVKVFDKLVFTTNEFKKVNSSLKDLHEKFYWISLLIIRLKLMINEYGTEKICYFIKAKDIKSIILQSGETNNCIDCNGRHLTNAQISFLNYLYNSFLPFVSKEYSKLKIRLKDSLDENGFVSRLSVDDIHTFHYESQIILKYLNDIISGYDNQLYYLYGVKVRYHLDVKNGVLKDEEINSIVNSDLPVIENTIKRIEIMSKNECVINSLKENDNYRIINNPLSEKNNSANLSNNNWFKIKDIDKLICLGSDEGLKKFLVLIQDYDIVENILDNDSDCKEYLSLFLNSKKYNISSIDPKQVRLKVDSSEFVFLIGSLCKSKHNKKYLFGSSDKWVKVSKLFLNKDGGSLNPNSMNSQFCKMRKGKYTPNNIEVLNLILSKVRKSI